MHANLMRVNPAVERRGLRHFAAERAVGMQIVHAQTAWIVIGHQHVRRVGVDRQVDRPVTNLNRLPVR